MYKEYSSEAFEKKYTYTGNDLGARWSEDHTAFRLWAPTASQCEICLYRTGTMGEDLCFQRTAMSPAENGTWTACIPGDLNGVYYTYLVTVEGRSIEACDPYAVTTGVNGNRAMVCNLKSTDPLGWDQDRSPVSSYHYTDYVIYELHVRDLSSLPASGIQNRGRFLGLTEPDTKLKSGQPTGLSHIKSLGVTHIHLLPVFDYGSVDEGNPGKEYNWGYDPVNFNVPEGSYSTNPYDGFTRVREMKQMVQALHRHGLGVILDVVYNHVYHTFEFSVNQIVPGYFSRENQDGILSNGSCCGNDTASERAMVRKYIVDSVNYWADEYHVDGFRFDLVGLLDVATIQQIIATVREKHPHVMFYGEGWNLSTQVTKPNIPLAVQSNAWMLPEFAFFNDTLRDTLRGSVFDYHFPGYISGAPVSKEMLLRCFQGRMDWSSDPKQIVNYVSCHDNHTLHDRIAEALPQAEEGEIARRSRFAAAFNLLSMGIPFFGAGEEILRSKKNRSGKYVGNSYRSSDQINGMKWNRLKDAQVQLTLHYYQGLLALRKAHTVFRLSDSQEVMARISLLSDTPDEIAAFLLSGDNEQIIAAFNPTDHPVSLSLPQGDWEVVVESHRAGTEVLSTVSGEVQIQEISAFVAISRNGNRQP